MCQVGRSLGPASPSGATRTACRIDVLAALRRSAASGPVPATILERSGSDLLATWSPAETEGLVGGRTFHLRSGCPPARPAPDMRILIAKRANHPRNDGPDARPPSPVMYQVVQYPPASGRAGTKVPPGGEEIPAVTTRLVGTVLDLSAARYAYPELRRTHPSTAHVSSRRAERDAAR